MIYRILISTVPLCLLAVAIGTHARADETAADRPARISAFNSAAPLPIPEMTDKRADARPLEYIETDEKIPNYTPSEAWGVQGKDFTKMQRPLSPFESMKHMVVPQGFRVELFADEQLLGGKPICMAWDERGRLWVAETVDYPNRLQPPGQGCDRIRILEDTNCDWRPDKSTLFADKLSIPTSIAFHRGGVIVQNGTETLYLEDTNGDGCADLRQVMFSGWSLGDTHGGVSNFQYGLDNWIWAMQGYNESRPVVAGKQHPHSFRQGFFRFRPDGSELEFLRSTDNNTWGLGISEEGIIFGSTANRNPSVYMPIPNRYYERVAGWTRSLRLESIADTHLFQPITPNVRQVDHHGGYTAGAGHALYTARQYPQQYWNRTALVNGPTGHLVGTFVLEATGSDFRSTSPFNLLASDDQWTAPIMSEIGPDGNVWVLDWYNYIVQHNPTPKGFETGKGQAYETSLRDKTRGRIYRVVYGKRRYLSRPFTLECASPEKLCDTLSHPTMLWRKHAQRLLVERGKADVAGQLIRLASDQRVDEIGLNVGVIHALWTLHGLGLLDGTNEDVTAIAIAALKHRSAGVRRNALQVLPHTAESARAVVQSGLLHDGSGQVRLAALLALADLPPTEEAAVAIAQCIADEDSKIDRWIADAAVSAAATNCLVFLNAVARLESEPSDRLVDLTRIIAEHYGRNNPIDTVQQLIGKLIDSTQHQSVNAIVDGLAAGWPAKSRPELTDRFEEDLDRLLPKIKLATKGRLVNLAKRWGSLRFTKHADQVATAMLTKLDNESLDTVSRGLGARQLIEFEPTDDEVVTKLLDRITPQTDAELAVAILQAIAASQSPTVGTQLVSRMPSLTPTPRAQGICDLLTRSGSIEALLDAIDQGTLMLTELSLDQRQVLVNHPDSAIRDHAEQLLAQGGALPNADRQKVLNELLSITNETGNTAAGQRIYNEQCANCHTFLGAGVKIGPDLTGMSVHPKAEILTHIIDPNRDVEGNFRVYTVVTYDGKTLSGLLSSESKTTIELFDSQGKKHTILRDDIEEILASTNSLMPEGFEKQLTREQLTDLLEFLTQRGTLPPLKSGTVEHSATGGNDKSQE